MSQRTIRECDNNRCGANITNAPYVRITANTHHATTVDLCRPCYDTFRRWLDPHMIAPGRDGKEIEEA